MYTDSVAVYPSTREAGLGGNGSGGQLGRQEEYIRIPSLSIPRLGGPARQARAPEASSAGQRYTDSVTCGSPDPGGQLGRPGVYGFGRCAFSRLGRPATEAKDRQRNTDSVAAHPSTREAFHGGQESGGQLGRAEAYGFCRCATFDSRGQPGVREASSGGQRGRQIRSLFIHRRGRPGREARGREAKGREARGIRIWSCIQRLGMPAREARDREGEGRGGQRSTDSVAVHPWNRADSSGGRRSGGSRYTDLVAVQSSTRKARVGRPMVKRPEVY